MKTPSSATDISMPTTDQAAPQKDLRDQPLRLTKVNGKLEHVGGFTLSLLYDHASPQKDVPAPTRRAGKLFNATPVFTSSGLVYQVGGSRLVVTPSALGYIRRSDSQHVSEVLEAAAAFVGAGVKNTVTLDTRDPVA